jgi:hypothetical protein
MTKESTGEKIPSGAKSPDAGERSGGLVNGVGLGKADGMGERSGDVGKHDGKVGEYRTGNMGEKIVYRHPKRPG